MIENDKLIADIKMLIAQYEKMPQNTQIKAYLQSLRDKLKELTDDT